MGLASARRDGEGRSNALGNGGAGGVARTRIPGDIVGAVGIIRQHGFDGRRVKDRAVKSHGRFFPGCSQTTQPMKNMNNGPPMYLNFHWEESRRLERT